MWTVLYSALNCVVVWGCILLYIWSVSHDVNVNFLWIFKPLCLFIVMLLQLNEWTVEPHWDCLKTLQCPSSSQAIMWSAQRQLPPHCQPNILAGTLGPNRCLWRHSTLLPESLWRHNGHACFYGRIHYGGNSVAYVLCSEQVLGTGDCWLLSFYSHIQVAIRTWGHIWLHPSERIWFFPHIPPASRTSPPQSPSPLCWAFICESTWNIDNSIAKGYTKCAPHINRAYARQKLLM